MADVELQPAHATVLAEKVRLHLAYFSRLLMDRRHLLVDPEEVKQHADTALNFCRRLIMRMDRAGIRHDELRRAAAGAIAGLEALIEAGVTDETVNDARDGLKHLYMTAWYAGVQGAGG